LVSFTRSLDAEVFHVAIPNVGFEAHAYLYHLVTVHDPGAVTLFLQADARHIVEYSVVRYAILHPSRTGFHYLSKTPIKRTGSTAFLQRLMPLRKSGAASRILTRCCALFLATRQALEAVPLEQWRRALSLVDGSEPVCSVQALGCDLSQAELQSVRDQSTRLRAAGFCDWTHQEAAGRFRDVKGHHSKLQALARYKLEAAEIERHWHMLFGERPYYPKHRFRKPSGD
jgi:hypothetical protein